MPVRVSMCVCVGGGGVVVGGVGGGVVVGGVGGGVGGWTAATGLVA